MRTHCCYTTWEPIAQTASCIYPGKLSQSRQTARSGCSLLSAPFRYIPAWEMAESLCPLSFWRSKTKTKRMHQQQPAQQARTVGKTHCEKSYSFHYYHGTRMSVNIDTIHYFTNEYYHLLLYVVFLARWLWCSTETFLNPNSLKRQQALFFFPAGNDPRKKKTMSSIRRQ